MSNHLSTVFAGNWDEIKGKVKNKWARFTHDDIDEIDGSIKELTGKLKKVYGYESDKIEKQLVDFFSTDDIASINPKLKEIKNEMADKSSNVKKIIKESLSEYVSNIKGSSISAEEGLVSYIKNNPLKFIGAVTLTGVAIAGFISFSKK